MPNLGFIPLPSLTAKIWRPLCIQKSEEFRSRDRLHAHHGRRSNYAAANLPGYSVAPFIEHHLRAPNITMLLMILSPSPEKK